MIDKYLFAGRLGNRKIAEWVFYVLCQLPRIWRWSF